MRLGKNGGTQSKCVEKVTAGVPHHRRRPVKRRPAGWPAGPAPSPRMRDDVEALGVHALFRDRPPEPAQVIGQPSSGRAFMSGRRVDVDERARQGDDVDGVRCHAAILSTTLNAEPAEPAERSSRSTVAHHVQREASTQPQTARPAVTVGGS